MSVSLLSLLFIDVEPSSVWLVSEEEQIVFIASTAGGSPTTKVNPLIIRDGSVLVTVVVTAELSFMGMLSTTWRAT